MRSVRLLAVSFVLVIGTLATRAAEMRIPAANAQCGSLARVAFGAVASGPIANVQFELAVDGAELVGVQQTPTTANANWIIQRVDQGGRTKILMRGGPPEGSEPLGQIVLRVPPDAATGVAVRLSKIRLFGNNFGEIAPDVEMTVETDCTFPPLIFRHLAGTAGGPGSRDGSGIRALLKDPRSLAVDRAGNIFVADSGNHVIRRIDAYGRAITLAGRSGVAGAADGPGSEALFQTPRGIAIAPDGSVIVADTGTQTIRRVSRSGEVTTIAGKFGESGSADGVGSAARFCFPSAVTVAADGSIIVGDTGYLHGELYGLPRCGQTIRRIDSQGQVSTIAGLAGTVGVDDGSGGSARFSYPSGVAITPEGSIWVADSGFPHGRSYTGRTIRRITHDGVVTTVAGRPDAPYVGGTIDGVGREAHFGFPTQLALEPGGTILVADSASIRRVTTAGAVTTVASVIGATRGVAIAGDGSIVASDPNGAIWQISASAAPRVIAGARVDEGGRVTFDDTSRFRDPSGVAVDADGNAFVADVDRIVRVAPNGGSAIVAPRGDSRPFARLSHVAVGSDGTLWATDQDRNCVWRIAPDGSVFRIGQENGWIGWADGPPGEALFFWPSGIAVATDGAVWVADTGNHVLRRITRDGNVSTVVGEHGVNETRDGSIAEARFNHPVGLGFGPDGELWVTESYGHAVRLVTPEGQVLTIAGGPTVRGDADGMGPLARFNELGGVAVDSLGRAWVADQFNSMLRIVERDGRVTTAAGGPSGFARFDANSYRGVDIGLGGDTRFLGPAALAFDRDGRLLVVDSWAYSVKEGVPCYDGPRCGVPPHRPARR